MSTQASAVKPRYSWRRVLPLILWPGVFLFLILVGFFADYLMLIDIRFNDRDHLVWKMPINTAWPSSIAISKYWETYFLSGDADLYRIQNDGSKVRLHHTKQGRINDYYAQGVYATKDNNIVLVKKDFRLSKNANRDDEVIIPTVFTTMKADGSVIAEFKLAQNIAAVDVSKHSETIFAMDWNYDLFAYDIHGYQLWRLSLNSASKWPAGWTSGPLIVSTSDGGLLTTNEAGALLSLSVNGDSCWEYDERHIGTSSLKIAPDGTIIACISPRGLVAINPDGTEKWFYYSEKAGKTPSGSLAIATDGTILYSNRTYYLLGLSSDGEELWQKVLGSRVMAIAAGDLFQFYVATEEDGFYCLDTKGKEVWTNPGIADVFGEIFVNPSGLIHIATANRLYALEP